MSYNASRSIAIHIQNRKKHTLNKNCDMLIELLKANPVYNKALQDEYIELLEKRTPKNFEKFPVYEFFERMMNERYRHFKNRHMPLTTLLHRAEYVQVLTRVTNRKAVGTWLKLPKHTIRKEIDWISISMNRIVKKKNREAVGVKYLISMAVFVEHGSESTFFGLSFFAEIHYDQIRTGMIFIPSKYVKLLRLEHDQRLLICIFTAGKKMYDENANYHIEANPYREYNLINTIQKGEKIDYDW